MADVKAVRAEVLKRLAHVVDLGGGVLRGDRQHYDKTFATTYVDLSDDIVKRSRDLEKFQEKLLGEAFFEGEDNQRWNSYLYFWAGPRSRDDVGFKEAKSRIERDRHYARKFVLTEEDLLNRIEDISRNRPKTVVRDDAYVIWSEQLRRASLGMILEQKPRVQLLRLIESGEAFSPETEVASKVFRKTADPLGSGMLRSLQAAKFRAAVSNGPFSFGDVNLIVGQNGSGKTSLLELIEALYCGRISRDPEAAFNGIRAQLQMPDGTTKEIKGTTAPATIKARNLSWYGRATHLASTISEGFTRFNFLDTDAAFRLSNETSAEKIREDLSRLLVGPETSALWTYLTKLHDDIAAGIRSVDERLPYLRKQTELLGSEVKRLQDTPSQATSLAKTYRASLKALGAKWANGAPAAPAGESDRSHLEALLRGFRNALAVPSVSPMTTEALRARMVVLDSAIDELGALRQQHETLTSDIVSNQSRLASCHEAILLLEKWKNYCEAGTPELVDSISRTSEQIDALRSSLGGLTISSIPEFSPEYRNQTVTVAKEVAEANLAMAQEQERSGVESLDQLELIAKSLQALKGDLRAIVSSIVERTGDSNHCPVCGTFHEDNDLLQKIDALESSSEYFANDGLRFAIRESRARADRERKVIAAINALSRYVSSSGAAGSTTIAQLREKLANEHNQLVGLLVEQDQLRSAEESLRRLGLDLASYDDTRGAVASVLGPERNPFDTDGLGRTVNDWEDKLQAEQRTASSIQAARVETVRRAIAIANGIGVTAQKTSTPADLARALDRMREQVALSLEFIDDASEQIEVPEVKSLVEVQSAIVEAIESFDRAKHAEASESSARDDLCQKTEELERNTTQVRNAVSKRERLVKAEEVLGDIALKYSLEDATRHALDSIREQVSYVFERIHSPLEYELGDFDGDSIVVTRDGKLPRGAHQVSTGQRAALALSIFLSLNQSADRAPPIMLIDDPVAHIDDLNALSFLDYLREMAVSERKQIFFATADTRVAALFQKKFEFLGKHRYRKIVLSR